MKRKLIVILTVFVVCLYGFSAYQTYINEDTTRDNEYTTDYSENTTSDLVGVWSINYESGKPAHMKCFNEKGEYYEIYFRYNSDIYKYGDLGIVNYCKGTYFEKEDNEVVVYVDNEEIVCTYSIDGNALFLDSECLNATNNKLYRKETIENASESLVGNWRSFNGFPIAFRIGNHSIHPDTFSFYYDGSFKYINEDWENYGSYRSINDGEALEVICGYDKDIYEISFIMDGLVLLTDTSNNTLGSDCILLEYVEN